MWLPRDERTLLAFCCNKISRGEVTFSLTHKELEAELRSKGIEADRQLIHETLFKLENRNLLRWGSAFDGNGVGITFYQQGYDLGQKYSSIVGKIAILCTEYMWFLILLGVIIGLIGIIATVLVAILKN